MVTVRKPESSLRLCLNPFNLNKNVQKKYSQIPTFEQICAKIPRTKIFTRLDADKGFWQTKSFNKSPDLTTLNTLFGRFKFLRMPYGMSSATEICQRCFREVYIIEIFMW